MRGADVLSCYRLTSDADGVDDCAGGADGAGWWVVWLGPAEAYSIGMSFVSFGAQVQFSPDGNYLYSGARKVRQPPQQSFSTSHSSPSVASRPGGLGCCMPQGITSLPAALPPAGQ